MRIKIKDTFFLDTPCHGGQGICTALSCGKELPFPGSGCMEKNYGLKNRCCERARWGKK